MRRGRLAVGHGETPGGYHDPGAVDHGWTEQSAGDIIIAEAASILRKAGFDIVDEAFKADPNWVGTTKASNARPDEWGVSAHHDWSGGINGVGAFWHPNTSFGDELARSIVTALADAGFPVVMSWVKPRSDLGLLNNSNCPWVLMEYGRIGSPLLNEPHELLKAGRATAAGIARHFGVSLEPAPKRVTRAVAISAARSPDSTLARALAMKHNFAYVEPAENGTWTQVYPDDRRRLVHDVEWLVALGWRGAELVKRAGAGKAFMGAVGGQTIAMFNELHDSQPERRKAWA